MGQIVLEIYDCLKCMTNDDTGICWSSHQGQMLYGILPLKMLKFEQTIANLTNDDMDDKYFAFECDLRYLRPVLNNKKR